MLRAGTGVGVQEGGREELCPRLHTYLATSLWAFHKVPKRSELTLDRSHYVGDVVMVGPGLQSENERGIPAGWMV